MISDLRFQIRWQNMNDVGNQANDLLVMYSLMYSDSLSCILFSAVPIDFVAISSSSFCQPCCVVVYMCTEASETRLLDYKL